ncbi:hypothetical protein [Flavobacterium geliluteum]|uniref:Uncharacterized protein n=1 Tax=Flavobacterium geliluteum TaxID=2816120 RepID=A0A940X6A1_9FLAO|nr:hypothetical protein [Flavobacterium geliluteum]MBP4137434.1 hypothetical protein [Flavobacterium geliluteum]
MKPKERKDDFIIIDDIDDDTSVSVEKLEKLRKNNKEWIEHYFPDFSEQNFKSEPRILYYPPGRYGKCAMSKYYIKMFKTPVPINLKVKRRYTKCPKINKPGSLTLTIKIN